MRLLAYELLTQAIILLGRARTRVAPDVVRVSSRVFDHYSIEGSECCDCGLIHDIEHFMAGQTCDHEQDDPLLRPVGHMWPLRPVGYRYRLRVGAGAPDLAGGER